MKRLRVAVVDSGKEWGGGTNSLLELLKRIDRDRFELLPVFFEDYAGGDGARLSDALGALGYRLQVLAPPPAPAWEKPVKEVARGGACFSRRLRARAVLAVEMRSRIQPQAARLAALLRDQSPDLLYLNNQPGSNLAGYLAARELGIGCVQHCRTDMDLLPAVAAMARAQGTRFICVAEGGRQKLIAAGIDAARCVTIPNGIDCHASPPSGGAARDKWGIPHDALVIGTLGRLVPLKRVNDLIAAYALLRARRPDLPCRLLIVGDGPQAARLREQAQHAGLMNEVIFTGFETAPLPLAAAMDVVALCSTSEGLPRVLLEAMWLGKPVVASQVAGSIEVVAAGETGLLYPCGDVGALSEMLTQLADDALLRERLGAAGAARVAAHFSIENYVAGVERTLADAWAGR